MSENQADLAVAVIALRNKIDTLSKRVKRLETEQHNETEIVLERKKVRRDQSTTEDPLDTYSSAIHERLIGNREESDQPFALAISNMVAQSSKLGATGTAFSLITIDKADDLPKDEELLTRMARFVPLLADPLVPRIFRHFLRLRFEGKPGQATAVELATALNSTTERIDELLKPLVEDLTLRRGLTTDGTPFYEWEGNDHRIMVLLFHS
jgi:hypothetical protein